MLISPSSNHNPNKQTDQKVGLPLFFSQAYYKHGLFLSSYPLLAISCAFIVVLLCCYPLLNIPLPGTIPTKIILPYTNNNNNNKESNENGGKINNLFSISNFTTFEPPFPWARSEPFIYVQQIILRSTVAPWNDNMILTDAFRGPLYEVFNLIEIIRNHEEETRQITLGHICLHIENVKRSKKEDSIFPEYNCLTLSPANFWQQNSQLFKKDTNLLNTIYSHQNLQKTKVSTADMLLGMPLRDTGLKRYPLRVRPRIIQYAVTLVIKENDKLFLNSLKKKLVEKYSLHQNNNNDNDDGGQQHHNHQIGINKKQIHSSIIMYIYYPGEFNLKEFIPLFIAFISLFLYVYFSLRKIDIIKSRIILAISSVITVLCSLTMSLGFCFFFGLTISEQFKDIYPYLVIIVGLENVLVITKSVVSIDKTLDVKIRLAKGLMNEGWSITKNLLTEITILTIGLGTFVPIIQEFCIFAIVGLISDFFLQMIFFSTILSMDIKRYELSVDEVKRLTKKSANGIITQNHIKYRPVIITSPSSFGTTINRSRSHPKLTNLQDIQPILRTTESTSPILDKKLPKRLRLFNFWARTRFFQRAFMIWMMVWISTIIYNSGVVEHFFLMEKNTTTLHENVKLTKKLHLNNFTGEHNDTEDVNLLTKNPRINPVINQKVTDSMADKIYINFTEHISRLKHPTFDATFHLLNFHWSSILKQYNISIKGKYVMVLPSIKLSHVIPTEVAINLRNPNEKSSQKFQWKAFAAALDPIDFSDIDYEEPPDLHNKNTPLYPKSPMEIFLTSILCVISFFVMSYTLAVLYRCICSRNYAEWRASWNSIEEVQPKTQQVLTCVTLQVEGHTHSIDCIAIDSNLVASSCLEGQIKIWDAHNGELVANITRGTNNNKQTSPPIWCLDYLDNLIAIGCADGSLEFWEGTTGKFKCTYKNESSFCDGATHIKLTGDKVVVARLSGRVDVLRLGTYNRGVPIDYNFSSAYRRTHVRAGSTGSLGSFYQSQIASSAEELKCFLECQHEGHQQPITCLVVADGIIVTGSQDHTLKVFKLENSILLYTLHGHFGPITCLFIDQWQSGTGCSGSEDGLLYIWDLIAGVGMYKIEAHNGPVISVVCAPSYVISLGSDGRLCVWERFQLNLLNTINVAHTYSSLLMFTSSLLVRAKPGTLIVLDVRTGETAGEAELDDSNLHICPKLMLSSGGSIVCDYGNQLRIVRFPLINSDKNE